MLRNVKLTLYEIFGYVLPGSISLAGIIILFWTIYFPTVPLYIFKSTVDMWILIILSSYILGHVIQAIGNQVICLFPSMEGTTLSEDNPIGIPSDLSKLAKQKLTEILDADLNDISNKWLFKIYDEVVVQCGVPLNREIFQYREGFYRGLTLSLFFLFLSLLLRTAVPGASVMSSNTIQPIFPSMMLFFIFLTFLSSLLSFCRYRRFARYRLIHIIIGFLALSGCKYIQSPDKPKMKEKEEIGC